MTLSSSKKPLILLSVFFLAGFLFFLPQSAYAAPVFTAGWYEDLGTGETDASCPDGYWRASIELINDLAEPVLADKITVRAVWYEEGKEVGISLYYTEAVNLTTSTFETDCAIPVKTSGSMALEVTAEEAGYYTMRADNNYRTCNWSTLNRKKWKKTLHLASLERTESPNIVYNFPDNNQWISARPEHSEMQIWVNNAPLSDNITQVDSEIVHTASAEKFSLSQATNIASGEVTFNLPALTKHGYYTWRAKLVRSNPSVLYNENAISRFNFDPNPPTVDYYYGYRSKSGKLQAPYVRANFNDEPLPSSGICRIEIYINDGSGTPLPSEPTKTCLDYFFCSYVGEYKEYTESETYTYYAIGYDCAGNETELATRSFTINPLDPSWLRIRSSVDNTSVTGVPFDVTDVVVNTDGGDAPATGTYITNQDFEGTVGSYTITLQAPIDYDERPFSFWMYSIYCYANPVRRTMYYSDNRTYRMYFGASRLMIRSRIINNQGSMSDDLDKIIGAIETRIEQTGGTPENLFGSDDLLYHDYNDRFYKTVTGEVNDLVLRFYDSEDGILKFASASCHGPYNDSGSWSCVQDPENPQQYQSSIIYECGRVRPYYLIQRTVRVEAGTGAGGGIPVAGVSITGAGGMQSGTTTAEGYYTFSSIAHPSDFTGWLWAPPTIKDSEGNDVEFGYWKGCEDRSADGLGCYIGTVDTWFYNVNATVKAHYTSEPDPETPFLYVEKKGNGTVTSSPVGICCGCEPTSDCSEYFATDTSVTLTAAPDADSYFVGWTAGDCSGTNPVCTFSMDSEKYAKAEFAPKPVLTVNVTGNGTVTDSSGTIINCVGPDNTGLCSASFNPNSTVTLTASHDLYWEFKGWTGDVTSTSVTISPIMNGDKTVYALFEALGPTAIMYSFVDPGEDDCRGPGCRWGGLSEPWITYHGTQYKIVNASTFPNPAFMYTSDWYLDGTLKGTWSCEELGDLPSTCHIGNIAGIAVNNYTLQLRVTDDSGGYDETPEKNLEIRPDTKADFKCSLDPADMVGEDCGGVTPITGQEVYFIDYSVPSGGATDIMERTWRRGHMDGGIFDVDEEFAYTEKASTIITLDSDTIRLIVKDDHPADTFLPHITPGRMASETKSLTVQFPLPKYREVAPR